MATPFTTAAARTAAVLCLLLLAAMTATLTATTRATAQSGSHEVQPGDTLSAIAARYGMSIAELVRLNRLANEDLIFAGTSLHIAADADDSAPGGETHVVRGGETLSEIASRYGQSIADLVRLNNLESADLIFAGTVLRVDAVGGSGEGSNAPIPGEASQATYTVQPGDTLSSIAARFQVTPHSLATLNGIANPNYIQAGKVLQLPAGAVSEPSHATRAEAEAALRAAAAEFGLSPSLVLALSWQESGWQQHVVSHVGAVGVMQVMPATAVWAMDYLLGEELDWRGSVAHNARVGVAVLAHWMRLSGGDPAMSLGAYYQGWGAMQAYGPYEETTLYTNNVLALQSQFQ